MTVEKKLSLPFADPFKVNIQIRIHRTEEGGFVGYIQSDYSSEHPLIISLTETDVIDLSDELHNALEQVRISFESSQGALEREEALTLLADKGSYAFKKIFPSGPNRRLIEKALANCNILQITSNTFLIPWEVLYDRSLDQKVSVNGFWGMRYTITRSIPLLQREADFVSALIRAEQPRVGLLTCLELRHVRDNEIPQLRTLHDSGRINLSVLRKLTANNRSRELGTIKNFLQRRREILHLACHAFEDRKNPSQSRLRLEEEFDVTIENYTNHEFSLPHFPLVILNACRTATVDPSRTTNWASKFWGSGARGILATEFRVPDWFAAAFIEQLYERLLDKKDPKPLGQSLMETRHYFWEKERNVLGLAYALYSSPDIQFIS